MKKYNIPYARQEITKEDILAVTNALNAELLTQGPLVETFENLIAKKVKAKYGCAFNSATSGLHAACNALGLGPGDILWAPAISFVASANCGLYCGASVDFFRYIKNYIKCLSNFFKTKAY